MTKSAYQEGLISKQSPDGELSFKPVTHVKFNYGYSFSRARDVAFYHQFNLDDSWLMTSPLKSLLTGKAYEITERGTFKFLPTYIKPRRDILYDPTAPFIEDIQSQTADVLFRAKCNIGSVRVIV